MGGGRGRGRGKRVCDVGNAYVCTHCILNRFFSCCKLACTLSVNYTLFSSLYCTNISAHSLETTHYLLILHQYLCTLFVNYTLSPHTAPISLHTLCTLHYHTAPAHPPSPQRPVPKLLPHSERQRRLDDAPSDLHARKEGGADPHGPLGPGVEVGGDGGLQGSREEGGGKGEIELVAPDRGEIWRGKEGVNHEAHCQALDIISCVCYCSEEVSFLHANIAFR